MGKIIKLILLFSGAFTIIGTGLPFIHKDYWWIRGFDFPRLQIAVIGTVTVLLYLIFWNRKSFGGSVFWIFVVFSVIYQAYAIYPYTPVASKQVVGSDFTGPAIHLNIVISNVLMTNRDSERYLEIVRDADADMVLAMETDVWWEEHLRPLEKEYPYIVKCPLENTYGMLLYSRLELVRSEIRFLVESDVPSIHSLVRVSPDVLVELHCLHPRPPRPFQSSTERDVELLLVAKEVRNLKRPVIVAGDLNDVAWSYTTTLFQKISGLLDPRVGRGLYNTFDAKNPFFRFPLDHLFHSNHFKLTRLKRLSYFGSDHFPMYVGLSLEPEAPLQQEEPSADKEDLKEAEEKIEKGKDLPNR